MVATTVMCCAHAAIHQPPPLRIRGDRVRYLECEANNVALTSYRVIDGTQIVMNVSFERVHAVFWRSLTVQGAIGGKSRWCVI